MSHGLLKRVSHQHTTSGSGPVRTYVRRMRWKLGDEPNASAYTFTKRCLSYRMPRGEDNEQ